MTDSTLFPKGAHILLEGAEHKVLASLGDIRFLSCDKGRHPDWENRVGPTYSVQELASYNAAPVVAQLPSNPDPKKPHEIHVINEKGEKTLLAVFHIHPTNKVIEALQEAYHASKVVDQIVPSEQTKARAQALLEEAARVTQYFFREIQLNQGSPEIAQELTEQRDKWVNSLYEQAKALGGTV